MTKKDLQLLIFFLLFVGLGLWGMFFYPYVEDDRAFKIAAIWFGIPSIALGAYYAWYNVFVRGRGNQANWRKTIGSIGVGIFAISIFISSFAGFIIIWNSNVGSQSKQVIQGQIIKVKAPYKRKMLATYSIYIEDSSKHIIALRVPSDNYSVGDTFMHVLNIGSLGLIYGR